MRADRFNFQGRDPVHASNQGHPPPPQKSVFLDSNRRRPAVDLIRSSCGLTRVLSRSEGTERASTQRKDDSKTKAQLGVGRQRARQQNPKTIACVRDPVATVLHVSADCYQMGRAPVFFSHRLKTDRLLPKLLQVRICLEQRILSFDRFRRDKNSEDFVIYVRVCVRSYGTSHFN